MLFFVLIGFVLFDASSVADFWDCIVSMFGGGQIKPVTTENLYYLKSYAVIILTAVIGATPLPARLYGRLQKKKGLKQTLDIAEILLLVMLLLLCVAFLVDGSFNRFYISDFEGDYGNKAKRQDHCWSDGTDPVWILNRKYCEK